GSQALSLLVQGVDLAAHALALRPYRLSLLAEAFGLTTLPLQFRPQGPDLLGRLLVLGRRLLALHGQARAPLLCRLGLLAEAFGLAVQGLALLIELPAGRIELLLPLPPRRGHLRPDLLLGARL